MYQLQLLPMWVISTLWADGKRVSIAESQKWFIYVAEKDTDIEVYQKDLLQTAKANKRKAHPAAAVLKGKDNHVTRVFLIWEENLYEFNDILPCLQYCYKIFDIFDLSFPNQTSQLWTVIEKCVFKIHKKNRRDYPNLRNVISGLSS